MDGRYLERVARDYTRELWAPKEVLYHCYRQAEPLRPTDRISAIRGTVSPTVFTVLQQAAALTLEAMHPEAEFCGVGMMTPECNQAVVEVPRSFVDSLARADASD